MTKKQSSAKRYLSTVIIPAIFIIGIIVGQFIHIEIDWDDDQTQSERSESAETGVAAMIAVTPDNITQKRTELIQLVFGKENLPSMLPARVEDVKDPLYDDLNNLNTIQRFEVIQNHDIRSIGYIFHPTTSNKRLMLYHQGHRGDFMKGKETLAWLVEKGFTVYAFCMPLLGKNNKPEVGIEKLGLVHMTEHERLKFLEYPIQYFITPIVTMLNYAEQFDFTDMNMVGISGGGWTTTLAAAADTRIQKSFPVAGTYPMFIRLEKPKKNYGDFEQTYPPLYTKVNYLDMYLLGGVGEGRMQLQILNEFDPCCFDERDYQRYHNLVSTKAGEFEAGSFDIFLDSSHKEHKISEVALEVIGEELGLR